MKKFVLTVSVIALLACGAYVAANWSHTALAAENSGTLTWKTNLDNALAQAKKEKKPLFVDIYATWCGPCRKMEQTTYTDEKVQSQLKKYVLVKIDADQDRETAKKFGTQYLPTLLVLNHKGQVVTSQAGYMDPDAFLAFLADAKKSGGQDELT
jgi:thiol:disulfide interchange protein